MAKKATASKKIAVSSRAGADQFRSASKQYLKDAIKSKASARKALVSAGIITKSGQISAKYK